MNAAIHHHIKTHLIKWPSLCGLIIFLLTQVIPAGQDYYINNAVVTNPGNIDATNFINNSSFSTFSFFIYETTDTLNYTNNGTMSAFGGFRFNTLAGGFRSMASSFYNPGTITVFSPSSLIVNATNIVAPGVMDVGANGLLQFNGKNIDLTYSTLTLEQAGLGNAPFGVLGTGSFGVNTNQNWDPSLELTTTSATSSGPSVVALNFSKSYFETKGPASNQVVRVVFVQNLNPDVPDNVYFGTAGSGLGGGNATIEWIGNTVDPTTGQTTTNHLYLNNDYVLGASTNVTLINGIPSNFNFSEGGLNTNLPAPAVVSFPINGFPSGAITNPYSFVLARFLPTSVDPNVPTSSNPTGALTNLPGRLEISASHELNLAFSTISGPNFLSLNSPNQFDGNVGSSIVSPFSDINLGVTNGLLTISNLLQSVIPVWNGTVEAWSTEFFFIDTNGTYTGFTNGTVDFRVLIVNSAISFGTSPQVQNLRLHGTNVIISDQFNILNNAYIDAQSLTLTANGTGAGSRNGGLNFESESVLFPNSLPNLLWLTNNGDITLGNAGNFGGPTPNNYQAFINTGQIFDSGSSIYTTYFENSGFIENGSGNFLLQSQAAVFTNGFIAANGDIVIKSDSLIVSGVTFQAGRSLTLQATSLLTDNGVENIGGWSLGASSLVGLNLPIKPVAGDLLGTSISISASANKNVVNTWAGENRGVSLNGYSNNISLGRLILEAASVPPHSLFTFNGAGSNNAIYLQELDLTNNAATLNFTSSNVTSLVINSNMIIYYAGAFSNGVSISQQINGWNNNRLRWVSVQTIPTNIVVQTPLRMPDGIAFTVSGAQLPSGQIVAGSAYSVVIQSATNLISPNWMNAYTGIPPFTFTSSGYTNNQQFYRAKQGW